MNYELAFGLRISELEKRMNAVEALQQGKRKANVLEEDEDDVELVEDESEGGEGAGEGAGEGEDGFETILRGVLRHSKPATDFEWARKQLNLVQTDPADLDRYFEALIQSLVICGYVDSFTAWLNRFVSPVSSGLLKPRNVEAYVMKNLLVLMNLQPAVRGKQGKDQALATLKKRSTYDKVIGLARRVARGESLSYEPSPAALQLQACPPKKARAAAAGAGAAGTAGAGGAGGAGRKKKLFTQKPVEEGSDAEESSDDEAGAGEGAGGAAEGDDDEASEEEAGKSSMPIGKGKGYYYEMLATSAAGAGAAEKDEGEGEGEGEDADEGEGEGEADEGESEEDGDEDEGEGEKSEDDDAPTQVQPATQQAPVVELKKVDLLAAAKKEEEEVADFFMPQPVVAPSAPMTSGGAGASDLRSRFMAKKLISSSSSSSSSASVQQHPMMAESAPLEWEPLDVNRRSMVQTSTDALDSYLSWRKAFEADPRFENRYTEYTRPNGERSTLTGYYVRFFTAWPCVVVSSPEEVSSMDARQVDTIYVRWLSTLSKTKSMEAIRERLL